MLSKLLRPLEPVTDESAFAQRGHNNVYKEAKIYFLASINLSFDWKIVERLVLEQIRNFIVLPNKISVPLSANIPIKGKSPCQNFI